MSTAAPPPGGHFLPIGRWEIPLARWSEIRDTVWDRLERSARRRHLIPYSSLLSGLPFTGPDSPALAEMLSEINQECSSRKEPLLAAIAVDAEDARDPAPGFYDGAEALHRIDASASDDERRSYWSDEVKRCFDHWGAGQRRS